MKSKSASTRFRFLALLIGLTCVAAFHGAYAIVPTVVAPNSASKVEGNTNSVAPFGIGSALIFTMRYQQLYAASQFSSIGPGGFITQLIFRPDALGDAFSNTLSDIQINLSITNVGDDALSSTFADNTGINDTVVFARGPLDLSSAFTGPADGPKDFDIVINLTTPFFYSPSLGNLLLDVRNFSSDVTTAFDAQDALGDGVSRVYAEDANASTATLNDSVGLVTGFTIVPEPSTVALLVANGGLALASLRWRRRVFRP